MDSSYYGIAPGPPGGRERGEVRASYTSSFNKSEAASIAYPLDVPTLYPLLHTSPSEAATLLLRVYHSMAAQLNT
jgi:hypothetical protein